MARLVAVLLLSLLVFGGAPAIAASPWQNLADPVFVRADTRELPEAAVMSLAQDSAGFLWVGTQGGLARFDGYRFRSFLPDPTDPKALPDGYVRTLLPDANGGVWIGSSSNGLVHFDPGTETFRTWRPDPAGRRGPRSASIDALLAAADGRLWIGGDNGLGRFDPRTGVFAPVALAARGAQPVVWSLLIDRRGTLWAGTQDGLYYLPAAAQRFRAFPARGPTSAIYSLFEDVGDRLWAGSVDALFVLDPARRNVRTLRSAPADAATLAPGQQWAVTEMSPGVMWAGTDSALSIVDARTYRVHRVATDVKNPGGLGGGRVLQFLRDRSGLVWLANHVGGLLLYNPLSRGLYELSGSRPVIGFGDEGAPAVAAAPGGRLWVGGLEGRLAQLQPNGNPVSWTLPNNATAQTLLAGPSGTLWIGTTGGLCRLRGSGVAAECPARPAALATASIYALLEEGGRLLAGGSTGLFSDDIASGDVSAFPAAATGKRLSNNQVRALYRDRRGRLWVGTENGLNRIDPGGGIVRFVYAPGKADAIGPGGVTTLLEDRRGRIWAGAAGGPLDILQDGRDGATHFRHMGLAQGLPHENVDGLAEDAFGRIWASTDKGIALIDPDTLRARGLGLADGVSEGAFWAGTVSQAKDGTIFFGGLDGITIVAPDASSPWNYAPPLVVSSLQVGRRNVPGWDVNRQATVELPPDARDISVEFAALDYSAPRNLRYAYRLDGYDREWIDADSQHRTASYTHLSPGSYTLEVRGTNRLGVWSRHVLQLGVRALPAWYETWWFRALVAAFVVLVGYGLHSLRTAVLRRRHRVLEGLIDNRTRELSEANAKLQELSLSDPLTGLRNRRFLAQHLDADVAVTLRRYADRLAGDPLPDADVLFFLVDLDDLKIVNDRFGHHAGDLVLVQMRERLEEVFRESDFVVRWGGDEFLAVVRNGRRAEAGTIAERIRATVAGRAFSLGGEQSMNVSVSVGFAAFPFVPSAPSAVTWMQVVGLADHALYMAKQAGRNTWYGLAASARTDPAALARLDVPAEELVRAAALEIIRPEVKTARPI